MSLVNLLIEIKFFVICGTCKVSRKMKGESKGEKFGLSQHVLRISQCHYQPGFDPDHYNHLHAG